MALKEVFNFSECSKDRWKKKYKEQNNAIRFVPQLFSFLKIYAVMSLIY